MDSTRCQLTLRQGPPGSHGAPPADSPAHGGRHVFHTGAGYRFPAHVIQTHPHVHTQLPSALNQAQLQTLACAVVSACTLAPSGSKKSLHPASPPLRSLDVLLWAPTQGAHPSMEAPATLPCECCWQDSGQPSTCTVLKANDHMKEPLHADGGDSGCGCTGGSNEKPDSEGREIARGDSVERGPISLSLHPRYGVCQVFLRLPSLCTSSLTHTVLHAQVRAWQCEQTPGQSPFPAKT